jgi:metal-responsive CopG/Arc/MetJ family transcriptional regulator
MKTAISIPEPLFQLAERHAQAKGLSRSELYAKALRLYLASVGAQEVTEALNNLYAAEESSLEAAYIAAQSQVLTKEDW